MDAVRSWAMSVCLAALAAGIAGMLAPRGNLEKILKFAVSLFFLCSVLVPLFSLRHIRLPDVAVSAPSGQTSFTSAVEEMSLSQVRESLAAQVKTVCTDLGVTPVSVEVEVEKNQDGAYDPKSAHITLSADQMGRAAAVAAAVKEKLGFEAQVTAG